jgi:hypothetical protein
MLVINKIGDTTYEIIEELKITSLWFSELDTEILKTNISLAKIEYTKEDADNLLLFNEELKAHLTKQNKLGLFEKLKISDEDVVLLKYVADLTN